MIAYGVFKTTESDIYRVGVRCGERVLDLADAERRGLIKIKYATAPVFNQSVLNYFLALGFECWESVHQQVEKILDAESKNGEGSSGAVFFPLKQCVLKLPVNIGGYTDFFVSEYHATHLGQMFRPHFPPLTPQWKYLPTAYHGRASSIVISGTKIKRPSGQIVLGDQTVPIFSPTQKFDIEVELGFIMGSGNNLGEPINIKEAYKHIFGVVLVNDWSARDIQRWEYVPLGPFLAKNFSTSISAWIVPMRELRAFEVDAEKQEPIPLDYLMESNRKLLDIHFDVFIKSKNTDSYVCVSKTNSRYLYWSANQMVAHHTVNGCNLQTGDLLATGTISGPDLSQAGSLIELTWNGQNQFKLGDAETRTFLENGDSVIIRGWCEKGGKRFEVGEVEGTIV